MVRGPSKRQQAAAAAAAAAATTTAASLAVAAAQQPSLGPLEGCVVAASGVFTGQKMTHGSVETTVKALGGQFEKKVTSDITHLVAAAPDFSNKTPKVRQAEALGGVHIVSVHWVVDSSEEQAREDELDYQFAPVLPKPTNSATTAVAAAPVLPKVGKSAAAAAAGNKRNAAASQADSDDNSQPTMKKKKVTGTDSNGTKPAKPESVKKEVKVEGQWAKKADVVIPVDEYFNSGNVGSVVYVAPDGLIYDAALNQSNASNNNNKFYTVQVVVNSARNRFHTWTRWGRVGDHGQTKLLGDGSVNDAIRQFEKKFREKTGLPWDRRLDQPLRGKYAFIERSYESDDDETKEDDESGDEASNKAPECTLEPAVQDLMSLIFNRDHMANALASLNYDTQKLPLGKLSLGTITRGFEALKSLNEILDDAAVADAHGMTQVGALEHFSNLYYTLIPHCFGRTRPPIINTLEKLRSEIELLDSLSDMKVAEDIMKNKKSSQVDDIHTIDRRFQSLGMEEMSVLDFKSTEFQLVEKYLLESRGQTHDHSYMVEQIFRIERQGEKERFEQGKLHERTEGGSNRRLLWHGSRCTNFGGILSQGLRIAPPEAPVSGYMFGKGIYLADMASKSANYCCAWDSGRTALLLLCEAELGEPMLELVDASYDAAKTAAAAGKVATFGMGQTGPSAWKDASCLHPSLAGVKMPDTNVLPGKTGVPGAYLQYNEYICYDVAQVRLRYLLRVKM